MEKRSLVSIVGLSIFVLIILCLHFLCPDYNPISQFISEYGYGRLGWLASIAFYAAAIGFLFLGINLLQLESAYRSKLGLVFIFYCALAFLLFGIFPMEPAIPPTTFGGILHYWVGFAFFIIGGAAPLTNTLKLKNSPIYKKNYPVLLSISVFTLAVVLVGFAIQNVGVVGLTQRLYILSFVIWSIYVNVLLDKQA